MPTIHHRMRHLQSRLLAIRLGSGAVVLPKDVKKIHMRFAKHIEGGHMGPRKFWHNELVRLKYHNPAVSMTVDRTAQREDPAIMSIHFAASDSAQQTSDSATSAPNPTSSTSGAKPAENYAPTERVVSIDMKMKTNSQILDELVKLTNAYPIEPTEQDREEMRMLKEQAERSARDSALGAEVRARVQREKALLEQARGDLAEAA